MRCANCGFDNPGAMKFCGQCTTPLAQVCPNCHFENPPGFKFCGQCTAALVPGSAKPGSLNPAIASSETEGSSALDGERKTVTALFADIKGSMELMEDLDPEEARAIVDPAVKLMIDAVHRYGGYIVQSTGDGIFALFGAPVAYEDHPQRALYAALRMQDEMRRYSSRLRQAGHLPIEARVGVNTGDVVVRSLATSDGHTEYSPIGHSTSLAARMQAIAPTGSIAVTSTTRGLCEGYFSFNPLGPTVVKGVTQMVEVFETTGLGPLRTRLQRAAARGLSRFVGRRREMEALKHAAEQARAGHGQIVAVVADPGVGKSRLFYEFKATSQSGSIVLEAFSVSHGKATAYLPLVDLLNGYFVIEPSDDLRRRREKIAGKVAMLDRSLEEETLPHLFALLGIGGTDDSLAGMDPQLRRRRTLDAIKRIVLRESVNQPLMLIFEDLHWIDQETEAFLNLLTEGIANAHVLMLVNYRPEYSHSWGSKTYYTQLPLEPLGNESAGEMLSALIGHAPALTPLKRLVLERTEGNPLFIEESIQALFDEGALVRNGSVKLTRSLRQLKMPTTVQGILAARIDRLPPEQKELLQTLAVIGEEPTLELIKRVTVNTEEQLERMLSDLQMSEFIYEQPSAAYCFKHGLTQEVAYNSLLVKRRHAIHEQTGRAIEVVYEGQLEEHYSDLARHYLRSSDATKAVRYARLAAEQAMLRGSYADASGLIQAALKLLEKMPETNECMRTELAIRSIESTVARVSQGLASQENERVIRRMCELGETIGEQEEILRGLLALSGLHFMRGESLLGLQVSKRCVTIAESVQDARLLADAQWRAGILAQHCGNFRESLTYLEGGLYQSKRASSSVSTFGLSFSIWPAGLAMSLQLLGKIDTAIGLLEEGLRNARESRRLYDLAFVLSVPAGLLRGCRREPDILRLYAQEAITLCEENGFAEWLHQGRFCLGWALAGLGQLEQGVKLMELGIAESRTVGGHPTQQYTIALLAHSYGKLGREEEALALLSDVLTNIEMTGQKAQQAEILRLKGDVLVMGGGKSSQAEDCFRTALEVARAQEAKWWELRTSVNLARLLRGTNRRGEARALLAEIYNWFTEGSDLPDLKDAKGLLDELAD